MRGIGKRRSLPVCPTRLSSGRREKRWARPMTLRLQAKVSRYIHEHGNALAIYKLTHNIPLASGDYEELERVLTQELGNEQDYKREFGETPFGLLVRRIAKLDHEAAMEAFSEFINDQSLNQRQIAFCPQSDSLH